MKWYRLVFRKSDVFPMWLYSPHKMRKSQAQTIARELKKFGYEVRMVEPKEAVRLCREQERIVESVNIEEYRNRPQRPAGPTGSKYSPRMEPVCTNL